MSHFNPNSKRPNNQVDWNDPHLESLLRKTESWKLDNRGAFAAAEVQVHVGWGANSARHAMLVWETDQVMVLETRFTLPQGSCPWRWSAYDLGRSGGRSRRVSGRGQEERHLRALVARALSA
jgi:hypothetical protein